MCPLGQVRGRYLYMSHRAPKCLATVLHARKQHRLDIDGKETLVETRRHDMSSNVNNVHGSSAKFIRIVEY
jgi:hypothetical protein